MNTTTAEYFTFNVDNSMLLVGQTGSGKSVLEDKLLTRIIAAHNPQTLQFVLIDMIGVDFEDLRQNHQDLIQTDIKFESDKGLDKLDELAQLSDERIKNDDNQPQIFICIEECDLAVADQARFDKAVMTINKNAKAANLKLIYSTSRIGEQTISKQLMGSFDLILVGLLASEETEEFIGVPHLKYRENYTFFVIDNNNQE